MREFSKEERDLMAVVDQFRQVSKYLGITPEEHLVSFDKDLVEGLFAEDILEKAKLKSFSQKIKGVRLTDHGLRLWREAACQEEPLPRITEAGLVVRDVLLTNLLSHTDEATPKSRILRNHSRAALVEAYEMGLLAKVRLKQKHREVVKGYIVTGAGYAYLKGNKLI